MTWTRAELLAIALFAITACKSGEALTDAGGAPPDATASVPAPTPPALPRFTSWSCPAGWTTRTVAKGSAVEHTVCAPPAGQRCADGQVQLASEAACRPLGACPSSAYLPEAELRALAPGFSGVIVYVQRGATGGDGSRAKPFGSVGDAVTAAAAGSIVALAAETHEETLILKKSLALVGACPGGTILKGLASQPGQPTVTLGSGGSRLANLTIAPEKGGVFVYGAEGEVGLERVEIRGAKTFGLLQGKTAPTLTLKDLVVRDIAGVGLAFGDGAVVKGGRVVVERVAQEALLVGGATSSKTTVTLSDLVLRDVTDSSVNDGNAVRLESPADVRLERCLLERASNVTAAVTGGGALALTDCQLRQTIAGKLNEARALVVFDRSSAELTRVLVEEMQVAALSAVGMSAEGPAPTIKLHDVVVRGTGSSAKTGEAGVALAVAGSVSGERVLVEEATDSGILIGAPGPSVQVAALRLQLSDLAILGTRGRTKDGLRGVGLTMDSGEVTLERALLAGNRSHGIIAGISQPDRAQPQLTASDLTIQDTLPDGKLGLYGRGLELQGTKLTLRRAALERNSDLALLLTTSTEAAPGQPSTATIEDLAIRDTRSLASGGYSGLGLVTQLGSGASVTRLLVERCHGVGLQVIQPEAGGPFSKLTLESALLRDTGRSACADVPEGQAGSCVKGGVAQGGGIGISLSGRVTATLRGFEVSGSALCGLQAAAGASATGQDGEVHHNLIGVNAGEGVDLAVLLDPSVRLHDNGSNVDATTLPVPGAAAVLKGLGL